MLAGALLVLPGIAIADGLFSPEAQRRMKPTQTLAARMLAGSA